jgi:hypothetical protein
MTRVCEICRQNNVVDKPSAAGDIASNICKSCAHRLSVGEIFGAWLEAIDAPILLMQGKPRQVITANQMALASFGKELHEVAGHRGGQVFDCLHSFSEAGCGLDVNCEECKIKGAIVDTFATNTAHQAVTTTLPIHKDGETQPYLVQVATKKIGELALVRVERFAIQ